MTDHRCHRGSRCAEFEVDDDGAKQGAQIEQETGLCASCRRNLARTLAALPRDYVELALVLGRSDQAGGEPITGTPEAPIPLRCDVEAIQAEMTHEAMCWAESTAEQLNITMDTQLSRNSRPGANLDHSCRLLARAVDTLLALRQAEHVGWVNGNRAVVWRDGVEGAVLLLDLHHRARHLLGRTRLVHRLPAPCPRCERLALERADGSEAIWCASCGTYYTWDRYYELCDALADRRAA